MVNVYIIYSFIAFVFLLNIGNFVRTKDNLSKQEGSLYIYLLGSILGWAICNAGADLFRDPEVAVHFARLASIWPINMVNALLLIARIFPQSLSKSSKGVPFKIFNILTIACTSIILFFSQTEYNIYDFEVVKDSPSNYSPGVLYLLILAVSVMIIS